MRLVLIGRGVLVGCAALATAACSNGGRIGDAKPGGQVLAAPMRTADGTDVGRATAREVEGGIRFTADVKGLPPGTHGLHVHTTGRCEPPDFQTAGPHWNPSGAKHGTNNPQGPHLGDLPNIIVGNDGRGTAALTMPGATLAGLMDADGAAMIVHAAADDLQTDPSGNSGGRIACGVFAAG